MSSQIKTDILQGDLYINGKWVTAPDQSYFESLNPATGNLSAYVRPPQRSKWMRLSQKRM